MTAGNGRAAAGSGAVLGDTVAKVVRQWQTVHPGLDTAPMEIIGRVNRCAALLQQAEDAPLRRAYHPSRVRRPRHPAPHRS